MLVDSHSHLDSSEFDKDRLQVIERSGLDYILNVAVDVDSLKGSISLAESYNFIYISAGIHPHNAEKEDFGEFQGFLGYPKIKAIGEIGLDYYRNYSPKDKQEEIFRECLNEAKRLNLPVVVHQRNAQQEVLEILKDYSVRGVMHCFSGTKEYAEECIDLGFYISFAGNLTYPKALDLREAAKIVPQDKLLIETDSPWLAPQPVRGKRNEPGFVKYTAEALAELRGVSAGRIGEITEENFRRLFKI